MIPKANQVKEFFNKRVFLGTLFWKIFCYKSKYCFSVQLLSYSKLLSILSSKLITR